MKVALLSILLLAGCEVSAPEEKNCTEFTYHTQHGMQRMVCRILWCEKGKGLKGFNSSGAAVLWCDEDK